LRASQAGKPPRSFTLDKRLQRFSHNGRFLGNTRIFLRLRKQFVVDGDRGSHQANSIASNIAPSDADFYALICAEA
jgi:hypothetical protein